MWGCRNKVEVTVAGVTRLEILHKERTSTRTGEDIPIIGEGRSCKGEGSLRICLAQCEQMAWRPTPGGQRVITLDGNELQGAGHPFGGSSTHQGECPVTAGTSDQTEGE